MHLYNDALSCVIYKKGEIVKFPGKWADLKTVI